MQKFKTTILQYVFFLRIFSFHLLLKILNQILKMKYVCISEEIYYLYLKLLILLMILDF